MDVNTILEMFGKYLYIFAVSTLQFFLNSYSVSFARIHVGMHCCLCMSPKQLLSPLVDTGWGCPGEPGPLTSQFSIPTLYSEAQISHFSGGPEMGPHLAKSLICYCCPVQDLIILRIFCDILLNASYFSLFNYT